MLLYGLLSFIGGMIVLLYHLYKAAILAMVLLISSGMICLASYICWFAYLSHHVCGGPRQVHYIAQSFAMRQYYPTRLIENIPWEGAAIAHANGDDLLETHEKPPYNPRRAFPFSECSALRGTVAKERPPHNDMDCLAIFSRAEKTIGMKICEVCTLSCATISVTYSKMQ